MAHWAAWAASIVTVGNRILPRALTPVAVKFAYSSFEFVD